MPVIAHLDDERARFYYDMMYNCLNAAARKALEEMMKGYEYQSDFAKKYVALGRVEGRNEGRVEGRVEGRNEGRVEGRNEGRIEGRVEGRVEEALRALFMILRVRGIAVPEAVREQIVAQQDPDLLERWLERAAVANSLAEVLD